jgi:hypothetical protein
MDYRTFEQKLLDTIFTTDVPLNPATIAFLYKLTVQQASDLLAAGGGKRSAKHRKRRGGQPPLHLSESRAAASRWQGSIRGVIQQLQNKAVSVALGTHIGLGALVPSPPPSPPALLPDSIDLLEASTPREESSIGQLGQRPLHRWFRAKRPLRSEKPRAAACGVHFVARSFSSVLRSASTATSSSTLRCATSRHCVSRAFRRTRIRRLPASDLACPAAAAPAGADSAVDQHQCNPGRAAQLLCARSWSDVQRTGASGTAVDDVHLPRLRLLYRPGHGPCISCASSMRARPQQPATQ